MRLFLSLLGLATAVSAATEACAADALVTSTKSTILVIARDAASAKNGYSGLQGYGIPFETLTVPSTGATLPALNSSASVGNFGGIIVVSEVSYQYGTAFNSALTTDQWQQLYNYQTAFGVRMVRLDVFPGPNFGTLSASPSGEGCCGTGVEQKISFTNTSGFTGASLNPNQGISTTNLWHYPSTVTDTATTWEVAQFEPAGSFSGKTTAAVVNRFANGAGSREQMVFFISWATDWNPTSNILQHAYINWVTRGLYLGFRRIYFSTQIDDVHLETGLYEPAGVNYRCTAEDLAFHATWQKDINSRLPAGSYYIVELGHNGNGNIEASTVYAQKNNKNDCPEVNLIEYPEQIDTPLEFQKPLGTGTNIWPTNPTKFSSTMTCMKYDTLYNWFAKDSNNMNAYAHMSHTYSHAGLNNATYSDVAKEISFNKDWLSAAGFAGSTVFSGNGLIPPAITGLHNGDAIRAWMDNGIKYVVGDNTRPVLMNQESSFWPLTSNVQDNGYAGLEIVPRWATTIYYNCDLPQCTTNEWINTSGGKGTWEDLLIDARATNIRHLMGLHQDPFMFHQANLRTSGPQLTINGKTGTYSLLMAWTEIVLQEMTRLTSWPIVTLKHDDISKKFISRRTRDQCKPALAYNFGPDGKTLVGVTVSSTNNQCAEAIPITFPVKPTSNNGGTAEQLGSDPYTVWIKLTGKPVTFTLSTPLKL